MIKQMQAEKELEGCTFAPQLQTKKKQEKRDLNKFLEDQKKYLEMKEQKQIERKEKAQIQEQSKLATQPFINEKSKKILEKKQKQAQE